MLTVTGPAAAIAGDVNLNGIVATPDGTLVVGHTANAALYTVDPETGASTVIAGLNVPGNDGIILRGGTLWTVQGAPNRPPTSTKS